MKPVMVRSVDKRWNRLWPDIELLYCMLKELKIGKTIAIAAVELTR